MLNLSPDLTLIVTAHNEAHLAGPSLHSAERSIAAAEAQGIQVDRIVGLDRPDVKTLEFFSQSALAQRWPVEIFDFGDPYRLRNELAGRASGKWVAWLDADDLISENWLSVSVDILQNSQSPEPLVVHPEINWIFDEEAGVFTLIDQEDPLFSKSYLFFSNYWDMMCVCPREVVLSTPYAERSPELGYGYEDWHWNLEVMHKGVIHRVARNTIIAKRRRRNSVSRQNRSINAVCRPSLSLTIERFEDELTYSG